MISFDKLKKIQNPYLLFAFLSFIILFDLLPEGYIFALDMVYTPTTVWSAQGFYPPYPDQNLPYRVLIEFLANIIQMQYIQKTMLFLTLFLSGISAYKLTSEFKTGSYFAGIIYMINPFVYERFLAGNLRLLMAYAILPIAVKLFMDLLEKRDEKSIIKIKLIFFITIIGIFNIHVFFLALLIYTFLFLFKLLEMCKEMPFFVGFKSEIKSLFPIFIGWGLLNLYWILPFIGAERNIIDQIGDMDANAFAPTISSFGSTFMIAGMYGFWRENVYILAGNLLPYWYVFFFFILSLVVHGFLTNYDNKEKGWVTKSFGIIAIISLILGSGVQGPFQSLFEWLFNNVFLFKGFRDSNKFVVLLILAYSYLGALGVMEFDKGLKDKDKRNKIISIVVIILAIMTPFIYSFTIFNGFWGQLKPTDYPSDWYEVNDFLNRDEQDFNVLFFPWHLYMDFKWVQNKDKRIVNPSSSFFDKTVIQGENIEIGSIYSQSTNPAQRYIESLLVKRNILTNFGELMTPLNVKYVLLTKEVDYKQYFFLFNQSDLELIKETENFYIFKNENRVAKIYQTDDISNIGDRKEIGYKTINPVRFEIEETNRKYLVFTEPYSEEWKLDGKEPVKAYGAVNAFENGGKVIRFERFYRIILPAYVVSILTFAGLIAVLNRHPASKSKDKS